MEKDLINNINYVLVNLKKTIKKANNLEDKDYLELSKKEIIIFLNYVYENIKYWSQDHTLILANYEEIEAIISELELCLADYDNIFHIEGISYTIYKIGKILFKK